MMTPTATAEPSDRHLLERSRRTNPHMLQMCRWAFNSPHLWASKIPYLAPWPGLPGREGPYTAALWQAGLPVHGRPFLPIRFGGEQRR
jgi:hypothetical protein